MPSSLKSIAVTGGSGKAGAFVVRHLLESGYRVLNLDRARPAQSPGGRFLQTDLTHYGETVDALSGVDAVIHLAAIPAPDLRPDEVTFRENIASTYNVFQAARVHRLQRVVWASSETVLGLPFVDPPPAYAPVDEDTPPLPQSAYSLSKAAGETLATHFARWTGVAHPGLRFSNVMRPEDYAGFHAWQDDPNLRRWNLWGYIDGRDVAQGCRLALEQPDLAGAEIFILAAADTVMKQPSAALMAAVYPDVPLKRPLTGNESILSIDKARRLLGYDPAHSWRDSTAP
ncbi:MAG: NAD(P)-dependent oxidoreductase [Puniceicoccaceae bacterium]|nr:MAG: NAD(P)-dependent oxidoreductase [Puniceicoccaceae bacterium]